MNEEAPALPVLLAMDDLLAQVNALRSQGADPTHASPRTDAVRLHYIEALTRRLQAAPPAVRTVLQAKLGEALKAGGGGEPVDAGNGTEAGAGAGAVVQQVPPRGSEVADVPSVEAAAVEGLATKPVPSKPRRQAQSKDPTETGPPTAPLSLLGQLNQHIRLASSNADAAESNSVTKSALPTRPPDLKSAVRFRETWARISAETEVDQATHRAPENAGPLNAHNLVLRTLGLMRELSPDYLRRFMSHTESLMWLDQAVGQLKQPPGKAKMPRAAKAKK